MKLSRLFHHAALPQRKELYCSRNETKEVPELSLCPIDLEDLRGTCAWGHHDQMATCLQHEERASMDVPLCKHSLVKCRWECQFLSKHRPVVVGGRRGRRATGVNARVWTKRSALCLHSVMMP